MAKPIPEWLANFEAGRQAADPIGRFASAGFVTFTPRRAT